ncbi:MAG: response regulator [Rickettsiales bacterium]|nr:response regulator [Rickettsiales bacterium]
MRIFTENTENYIQALAVSVSKDPASLDTWRCLYLHPHKDDKVTFGMADKIKESYPNTDCDIIFCADGDVLFISRELNTIQLQGLADVLSMSLTYGPEVSVYDLFHDWRKIRSVLVTKTNAAPPSITQNNHNADFGEIGSLQEAFAEAKKLRSSRHPQYVMVVDDDPLTRRLVSGAFKEKYALITAVDAQEAVANYLLHAPDIVFLDINMPGISGFAVLRQLIASDPDAYIIMFSGNSYLDNVTTALSEGACGFVAKPFKKDRLRHYIEDSAMHHHKYT